MSRTRVTMMRRWILLFVVVGVVVAYFGGRAYLERRAAQFRQAAIERITYYRFRASFIVKETKEPIDFDYVVACGVVETTYRDGDRSMDTLGVNPKTFIKATRDGHAIQVWTPQACRGEIRDGYIPPDLFAFATFYDDVNDMSFGWGYASQDAYDSPRAKMSFEGPATIEAATYADWKAWRTSAEAAFKPIGKIRSPWGYSYEDQAFITGIASGCAYYKKLPLNDLARAVVTKEWVSRGRPEFWPLGGDLAEKIDKNLKFHNGDEQQWVAGNSSYDSLALVPRTKGGGIGTIEAYEMHSYDATRYRRSYDIPPTEVFPLLPPWAVRELPDAHSYPPMSVVIEVSEAFRGFVACGAREEDRIEPDGSISKFVALRNSDRKNGTLPKYRIFVNTTEITEYAGCNGHACFPQDVFYKDEYFLNENRSSRYFE